MNTPEETEAEPLSVEAGPSEGKNPLEYEKYQLPDVSYLELLLELEFILMTTKLECLYLGLKEMDPFSTTLPLSILKAINTSERAVELVPLYWQILVSEPTQKDDGGPLRMIELERTVDVENPPLHIRAKVHELWSNNDNMSLEKRYNSKSWCEHFHTTFVLVLIGFLLGFLSPVIILEHK